MRKTLMLSLGVPATLVAAVFVGAAAATTGAPVFYDARYPAPATTGPGGYDVSEGDAGAPDRPGAVDEADVDDAPPAPPPAVEPSPPATVPPTGAPEIPTPTPTPTPDPDSTPVPDTEDPADRLPPDVMPGAEEQQAWLAFQQIVRECMAAEGHEYLYWEWWSPAPDASNRFRAMPADLTADEAAAWELALHGDSPGGDAYRWEDAGCWGYAVHVTGGTN